MSEPKSGEIGSREMSAALAADQEKLDALLTEHGATGLTDWCDRCQKFYPVNDCPTCAPESAGAATEAALREAMQAVILAHDEAMPRAGDGSGCHCNLCAKYRVWLSGALASAPPPERHHA